MDAILLPKSLRVRVGVQHIRYARVSNLPFVKIVLYQ